MIYLKMFIALLALGLGIGPVFLEWEFSWVAIRSVVLICGAGAIVAEATLPPPSETGKVAE